jgi:glycosyltransferase involved in cell wall biosynthesis
LHVCVDARIVSGSPGGIEQAIVGLASGLSRLTDSEDEYLFLTYRGADTWLRPYLSGPCRVLPSATPPWQLRLLEALPLVRRIMLGRSAHPLLGRAQALLSSAVMLQRSIGMRNRAQAGLLRQSEGVIERAGADVMHFMRQDAFLTSVPSIYHPWDLQHLHLPQFFTPAERLRREVRYRAFCRQASMVAVASRWGKQDLIRQYGLPEQKVQVVPMGAVLSAYPVPSDEDLAAVRSKYTLPSVFALYPAQTWAHKNHLGLLDALSVLRDRYGLVVPLVASGRLNAFFPSIERRARELRLSEQVSFLGFVSPLELQCLYRLARCVVFPTKFEGLGMPLAEAFSAGTPVASSNVTCLPEAAGDAALFFNPDRAEEMAAAILRLWTDAELRKTLIERGRTRVQRVSWERTARIFRAHYRRVVGHACSEEDRALLMEAQAQTGRVLDGCPVRDEDAERRDCLETEQARNASGDATATSSTGRAAPS